MAGFMNLQQWNAVMQQQIDAQYGPGSYETAIKEIAIQAENEHTTLEAEIAEGRISLDALAQAVDSTAQENARLAQPWHEAQLQLDDEDLAEATMDVHFENEQRKQQQAEDILADHGIPPQWMIDAGFGPTGNRWGGNILNTVQNFIAWTQTGPGKTYIRAMRQTAPHNNPGVVHMFGSNKLRRGSKGGRFYINKFGNKTYV